MGMQKQFLLFLFSILLFNTSFGQESAKDATDEAIEHIKSFKNGAVLVIKLPTSMKALDAIHQDSIDHQKNTKYIERLNKRKKNLLQQNQTYQKNLMSGLNIYYKYNPFIAVYDTSYNQLLNNPTLKGVFYDKNLKLAKDYSLENKRFYTFRLDQVYPKDNNNRAVEAFVITDSKGNLLKYPFPYAIAKKFRKVPVLPNNLPSYFYFNTHGAAVPYYSKEDRLNTKPLPKVRAISGKKLDKNYYYAIAKFLQLRMKAFEDYIGL